MAFPVVFFNPNVGGIPMRMLLKAQADTLSSNPKIKDGSLGNDINSILADTCLLYTSDAADE